MKKQDTFKGKVEVEIGGVKYVGTVDLKPTKEAAAAKAQYAVYGVRIDRKNSDPEAAVEYIGAAAGFTPAKGTSAGSWGDVYPFNKIRPCLLNNGKVSDYLNPNNYGEGAEGEDINTADASAGDIMVEFPKVYCRIRQDEQYTYVEITDSPAALEDGFTDYAFSYKGTVRDAFYVGAYKGYIQNGKLRSVADRQPTGNKKVGEFRTAAQANGEGYEIMAFNKLVLLQALYLIRFKSRNSQAALGAGLTNASEYGRTGATDAQGLYYGDRNPRSRVKCHGIEDFWGNIWEWVDGLITTSDAIIIADGNFNDKGEGYEKAADLKGDIYGIITDIYGDSKLGFLPKEANGGINPGETHYCNYGATWQSGAGCFPYFGGSRSDGADAGAFYFYCGSSASFAYASIGARLLFCGSK